MAHRALVMLAIVAVVFSTAGCSSAPSTAPSSNPDDTNAGSDNNRVSAIPDPIGVPTLEGRFPIGTEERKLALTCWGVGSPAVLFDAGSGDAGINRWKSSTIPRALAARTQVCAYDRAGLGDSDPAPLRPRILDEVVDDLHLLLAAAGIDLPVVMVGSSGGGFEVYHHAGRYPDEVAGLVLLDVPAGQAAIATSDVPAWDSPDNPEHMDYVAVEHQMAVARLPIPAIPVTVVAATRGQSSNPDEQKVWLEGSSLPIYVLLDGGHLIYDDDPLAVLEQIMAVLYAIGASR